MEDHLGKGWKLRASYTIEAGIVGVFLVTFLGMGISYEINHMNQILDTVEKERIEKERWEMNEELEQYLKYHEIKDLLDEVIGG